MKNELVHCTNAWYHSIFFCSNKCWDESGYFDAALFSIEHHGFWHRTQSTKNMTNNRMMVFNVEQHLSRWKIDLITLRGWNKFNLNDCMTCSDCHLFYCRTQFCVHFIHMSVRLFFHFIFMQWPSFAEKPSRKCSATRK